MVSITQQAQRVLSAYREEDREHGTVCRVSTRETGGIQIRPAPAMAEDTVISDVNGPLLAIDPTTARQWGDATVLHYRTAADIGDAPEGWVLLKTRGSQARAGLALSPTSAAASRARPSRRGPVLRAVGAIVQALR